MEWEPTEGEEPEHPYLVRAIVDAFDEWDEVEDDDLDLDALDPDLDDLGDE